mmetsp:Transcript_93102/g.267027  ORF Transcript_93102/g.267027 Transcript_93102/m.267027 type:complete len:220 (+) Transcript_93102:164-823(+)
MPSMSSRMDFRPAGGPATSGVRRACIGTGLGGCFSTKTWPSSPWAYPSRRLTSWTICHRSQAALRPSLEALRAAKRRSTGLGRHRSPSTTVSTEGTASPTPRRRAAGTPCGTPRSWRRALCRSSMICPVRLLSRCPSCHASRFSQRRSCCCLIRRPARAPITPQLVHSSRTRGVACLRRRWPPTYCGPLASGPQHVLCASCLSPVVGASHGRATDGRAR